MHSGADVSLVGAVPSLCKPTETILFFYGDVRNCVFCICFAISNLFETAAFDIYLVNLERKEFDHL